MSQPQPAVRENLAEISDKLAFTKKLQAVTNKIHSTRNVDEIMLELSGDICALFGADRLTIYATSKDGTSIVSKVKTGLTGFKDLNLPISSSSVAGHVARTKSLANIADVYDMRELGSFSPQINFLKEVDQKTGYRTKQMLVAPIIGQDDELLGVVQLINSLSGLPFSPMLVEGVGELAKTLAVAFAIRNNPLPVVKTKFDFLVSENLISLQELDLASRSARKKGVNIEDVLVSEFQIKAGDIGNSLATYYQVPYEPFRADRIKPMDLLTNLKREYVESNQWLPVEDTPEGLVILSPDPERVKDSRIASNVFPKRKLAYRTCTQQEFLKTIDQFFGEEGDTSSIGDMLSNLEDDGVSDESASDEINAAADNELVKLVNKIIVDAYNQGASDIHIEPGIGKEKTVVRFRRDGTLGVYIEVPASYRAALTARLKIMCDLDISEKRKPQDGKIKFKKFGPLDIELRVATLPSAGGVEDIVMRILAAGEPIPLEKLGLSQHNFATLKEVVSKPYGLFFVCGPTGSGKTTTLHSVLKMLNTPETKIWTAEDPVEITQKGLRQVQMNPKAGLTFAIAMRAFLRADPDVIMVGEMRDKETVSTGIEASLTGHLVLATLHTNSAPESIIRLLDMGMDPFNFADALLGILAQRLAKRLCSKCKKERVASTDDIKILLNEYCSELTNLESWKKDPKAGMEAIYKDWLKMFGNDKGQLILHDPVGCDACNGSGYKGRLGLHELLVGTDAIKKNIQEHARVAEMLATCLNDGMRTLKQDGIEKVLQGITDLKQVRSVCIK
ncbi:MAG: GspE/PulE family protein [Betaproteobacteria bacterium]|nr:GspE/PulE family protein [Betaproteobacteria bacterium]